MEATELKRRLAQACARGKRGYPRDLCDAVVAYAGRRKANGISQRAVAAELGLSEQTLWYWRTRERKRGELVPVTMVPAQARELVLEFGPLRVRGLDVHGLAELFRSLG
jgi:Homeodomain-like domain